VAATAYIHLDIKKGNRVTLFCFNFSFMTVPAVMIFFTALMVALPAAIF